MKKLCIAILLGLSLIATSVSAGEIFTLQDPITISNQAYSGEIISYCIIPGPPAKFVISFIWLDDTGKQTGASQNVTWTGQDFQDIFGFIIRTQDVGTSLGVGLRTLIHNKIEAKYNVVIE